MSGLCTACVLSNNQLHFILIPHPQRRTGVSVVNNGYFPKHSNKITLSVNVNYIAKNSSEILQPYSSQLS